MRSRSPVFITVLACVFAASAGAQFKPATPPKGAEPPTFSVEVRMVRVLVSVKDASGRPVSDLDRSDFELKDSGVPQAISVFERNTSQPLSVAILIDTSGSTRMDLHDEENSLQRFLPTLVKAGDEQDAFALFSFNWRITLETDYARNLGAAERALGKLRGEGGTSMYDAICLASETLRTREGRHIMVIVTDGEDTASYRKFEDALRSLQVANTAIYAVVVVPIENDAGRSIGGEHALQMLAGSTGGRVFYPDSYSHINEAFSDILRDLRAQYLLGFLPAGVPRSPGSYHPIKVGVDKPGLRISARSGYFEP